MNDDIVVSKTKRKKEMDELQHLGNALVNLSKDQLAKFVLSEQLLEAILLAQRITSNSAIRRQSQYIGKLMRTADVVYIRNKLAEVNNESVVSTKLLHLSEKWRDRLLATDTDLSLFVTEYPSCNITDLRNLIRAVRKEIGQDQRRNYRNLYKLIRHTIEGERE